MNATVLGARVQDAYRMLDAFVSVGVRRFSLSRTDINRVRTDYRVSRNQAAMRLVLPHLIPLCWERQENLIVRPEKPSYGVLAQLDDLDARQLDRLRPMAFLLVETSPGNHQVWLMIEAGNEEFVKRLMRGVGSDTRANCSGRVPGSPNVKSKYAPNFPTVKLVEFHPGRGTVPKELESLGLVAPPVRSGHSRRESASKAPGWPDYDYCLRVAPLRKKGDGPDRSAADCLWCQFALERGHDMASVEMKLVEVSEKAREEWDLGNKDYVRRTVEAADKLTRTKQ